MSEVRLAHAELAETGSEARVARAGHVWLVRISDRPDLDASAVTQRDAIATARPILLRLGGGVIVIHDRRGRIREVVPVRR